MSSPATAPQIEKPGSEKPPFSFSQLEQVIRQCATLVLICYAVGLIVNNLYLYVVGISDFSLFRAKAILTGFWTLIAFLSCSSLPVTIELLRKEYKRLHPSGDFCLYCLMNRFFFISFCILLPVILDALFYLFRPNPRWSELLEFLQNDWLLLVVLCLLATGAAAGAIGFFSSVGTGKRHVGIIASMSSALHFGVAIPIFFGAIFVWLFALLIYPRIPDGLGGGKARIVRLLLTPELAKQAELLHIPLRTEAYSKAVYLDYEGEDFLVIGTGDRIIRLDKKLVSGFLPRPAFFMPDVKAWDQEDDTAPAGIINPGGNPVPSTLPAANSPSNRDSTSGPKVTPLHQ